MKKSLLVENQYFPVVNWFKYSFQVEYIIINACEPWQKMSFRNRTVICGSNGLINLSVPVEAGRNQRVPFKDIRISYRDNWQINHWRSICSCYGKAPFFEFYDIDIKRLLDRKDMYLFDLNIVITEWLIKILKCNAVIQLIQDQQEIEKDEGAISKVHSWLPKNFQEGTGFLQYQQVFQDKIGFQPNVSILDLLFNTGPQAARLLQSVCQG